MAACYVGYHLRDEEWVELRAHLLAVDSVVANLLLEGLHTADADTHDDTDTVLVDSLEVHARVIDSLCGCCERVLAVGVHLAGLLAVYIVCHLEVLHLTCEVGLEG